MPSNKSIAKSTTQWKHTEKENHKLSVLTPSESSSNEHQPVQPCCNNLTGNTLHHALYFI